MANLTLPSRDIVPRGDLYHLPAEASLFPAKTSGSQCPQHRISPGHRTCGQDAFWAATKRETNQKGFKLVVGLHHPTEPHKGNSCAWAELSHNAQIVHRTMFMNNNYCSNSPSLVPREFGFCGPFRLNGPTHMTHLSRTVDIDKAQKNK